MHFSESILAVPFSFSHTILINLLASRHVHDRVAARGLYRKQVYGIVNYPKISQYKDEKASDPY